MTIEELVKEHMRAMLERDEKAMVDGYADDAVVLAGAEPIVGKDAITAMLKAAMAAPTPPAAEVSVDLLVTHGEYAYVAYQHGNMRGGDSFHFRDGKILMQSAHISFV